MENTKSLSVCLFSQLSNDICLLIEQNDIITISQKTSFSCQLCRKTLDLLIFFLRIIQTCTCLHRNKSLSTFKIDIFIDILTSPQASGTQLAFKFILNVNFSRGLCTGQLSFSRPHSVNHFFMTSVCAQWYYHAGTESTVPNCWRHTHF